MATAPKSSPTQSPPDGGEAPLPGRSVPRAYLVNRLNYLNFQDQTILVGLRHLSYDNAVTLRARPLPCDGERLQCQWAEVPSLRQLLVNYRFEYLLIPDGKKYLLVNPEVVSLDEQGFACLLPISCHEYQLRKIKRHQCDGVQVELNQHGAVCRGEVLDFTPVSLRASTSADPPETFYWINPEVPLNLRLHAGGKVLYTGPCDILWQSALRATRTVVLKGMLQNIRRFKGKKYRNSRQQLVPSPNVVFEHPVIGRRINLKVGDISGSGFSVEENEEESVLLPGLIIPELRLSFAQGLSLRCKAQVVFRRETGAGVIRCGVAILDMDIRDHVRLLSMLHQVANQKSYVCTEVELDELWNFFFETGFIYPEKYAYFQAHKDEIKKTYARLYEQNPQIARHFIYQERGAILGHLAMVRFYRDSWLIHHHAARKSVAVKAGLAVLDQVGHYLNELGNFRFAHLRHVYCYYRPDNRFPDRVFGGFARQQRDPRVCSLDSFGYWRFHGEADPARRLPRGWDLTPSTPFDHGELASFYGFSSGGLMVEAFDLAPGGEGEAELSLEYRRLGFRREVRCFSLRRGGSLKAFFLASITDAGFNMADLTNCVTAVVLDAELPPGLLARALARMSRHYPGGEMPVLAYPVAALERQAIQPEKIYQLWILNLEWADRYYRYCERLFKSAQRAA